MGLQVLRSPVRFRSVPFFNYQIIYNNKAIAGTLSFWLSLLREGVMWYLYFQITNNYYNKIRKISLAHWKFLQEEFPLYAWQGRVVSIVVRRGRSSSCLRLYTSYLYFLASYALSMNHRFLNEVFQDREKHRGKCYRLPS